MASVWTVSLSSPSTSWALLELANDKEELAWSNITRIYAPLVYAWARRSGLRDSDASDATQDVFLKVYLNLAKCQKERGRFRSWLWTITRRTVIEHYRRQTKRPVLLSDRQIESQTRFLRSEPDEIDPDHIPHEILLRALEIVRSKFKESTFQAGWRTIALGLNPEAVAAGLDLSIGAVYIAKSRLLKELRNTLAGLEDWKPDCPRRTNR